MNNSRGFWLVGGFVVLATLAGCGGPKIEKGVIVKGKVLKGGAPIPGVRPDAGLGLVQITLLPLAADANKPEPGMALLKADGSFEIPGHGKGIRPGKYKVVIVQRDARPGQPSAVGDKFTQANTKLEVEIPADKIGSEHDLGVIDVDK